MQSALAVARRLGAPVWITLRRASATRDEYLITDTEPERWLYRVAPDGAVERYIDRRLVQ